MLKFAFVSRHEMTEKHVSLAAERNIELVPVGDMNGFGFDGFDSLKENFNGVVVVHAGAALNALAMFNYVGVFENAVRCDGMTVEKLHVWGGPYHEVGALPVNGPLVC